jgi:hypothetical protein
MRQHVVSGERRGQHHADQVCGQHRLTFGDMGMFEVKGQAYGFMGSSPAVGSDPKSEPVSMT